MSDPVITSQAEESQSWYSPLVDSAKSYIRPLYDEGIELLEKTDRYVEEKKEQVYGAYNYVVQTPAEKIAADALGYVQRHYPEQTKAVAGLAKRIAPSAARIYRAITPDPVESFISSQTKEFLQEHEEGAEILAEALGGEALVQSLNEYIWEEEAVAVIEEAPVIETLVVKEVASLQSHAPVQKKVEQTQKATSVAVVEEDAFYEEEIPDHYDEEIILADSDPEVSSSVQVAGESVALLEPSVSSAPSNNPELTEARTETTPQVEPEQEGKPTHVVETVEIQTVVVSTEEGVPVSSSDLSADVPVVLAASSGDVQNEPKAVRQTTSPRPQPVTPESPEGMISVHISDERIDFGDQTETLPDVLLIQNSDDQAPILPLHLSSPSLSSSGALNPDKNPLQQIDSAIERRLQAGNQPSLVPSFRSAAQAVGGRDLQADESETRTVAQSLDSPFNDIPGSADKGFDSDDQGKDRTKELMFALADALVEDKQGEVDSTLEDAILPSSLRADVFLTT